MNESGVSRESRTSALKTYFPGIIWGKVGNSLAMLNGASTLSRASVFARPDVFLRALPVTDRVNAFCKVRVSLMFIGLRSNTSRG